MPDGPRVVVIGSTDFWHAESAGVCAEVGQVLATVAGLVLVTGGVEGVGEAVGRSFFEAYRRRGQEARVYHVLPHDEEAWDYGETLFAGADMFERREVLARLSNLYLAIEGGPGTAHEAEVAAARGAVVLPVGRLGGHAAVLYGRMKCPAGLDELTWSELGKPGASAAETARAVLRAVQSFLDSSL
jgi:uncharacterized protein (TIGR00725 family)